MKKKQILESLRDKTSLSKKVEVDGVVFHVKLLNGYERYSIDKQVIDDEGNTDIPKLKVLLAINCIVDEDGVPLFDSEESLKDVPSYMLEELIDAVLKLNGIQKKD